LNAYKEPMQGKFKHFYVQALNSSLNEKIDARRKGGQQCKVIRMKEI